MVGNGLQRESRRAWRVEENMTAAEGLDIGTVVVGCDGSWQSEAAVEAATREAARRKSALALLVVLRERDLAADHLSSFARREREALAAAEAVAKRAKVRAARVDAGVPTEVVTGTVDSPAVLHLARRASLLVLGGHGGSGQKAFSVGSVSGELVRGFDVPVYVPQVEPVASRPKRDRPASVVVGVDGRGGEETLLTLAAEEAVARGTGLVIVRAVRPGTSAGGLALPDVWDDTWMAVRQAERTADVSSRVTVVVGEPVPVLLAECDTDDLLVVGTRGGGRLAGLIAGSVARGVLDGHVCDVIVVPPGYSRTTNRTARQGNAQMTAHGAGS